ncbi:MAG: trypsin-like peptidase domain-containing protein [Nitrospinales bacterium]
MKNHVVKILVLSFFAFGFLSFASYLNAEHSAGSLKILEEVESGFVALAKHTQPAVINLSPFVPKSPSVRRQGTGRKGKPASAGAGVIIDSENGYAVTNHHVVKGSDTIQVTLYGGKKVLGKVIGSDEDTDLAVIKIETDEKLASVELGDSSKVKTGQLVVAIGNPYGLNDTFSLGIVSGLNRENVNISRYEDFIQTDASINPGNSGGPLINIKGEVIGINTAIINYAQSIGFSIPSNIVKRVVTQLIEFGEVKRGWLGVGIDFVPDDVALKSKIEQGTGVLVNSVFEGQPASEVGVLVGDIILKIGGSKVNSPSSMIRLIGSITPGQIVQIDILRDGERKLFDLQLGKREASTKVASLAPKSSYNLLGFKIDESGEKKSGVIVSEVSSGSQAEIKGLKVGDSISAVNGETLNNKVEFNEIVDNLTRGKPIFLLIARGDETIRLVLNE